MSQDELARETLDHALRTQVHPKLSFVRYPETMLSLQMILDWMLDLTFETDADDVENDPRYTNLQFTIMFLSWTILLRYGDAAEGTDADVFIPERTARRQAVAAMAHCLASKYEKNVTPCKGDDGHLSLYRAYTDDTYTVEDLGGVEWSIASALDYSFHLPTGFTFLCYGFEFLRTLDYAPREDLWFTWKALMYDALCAMHHIEFMRMPAALQAAALVLRRTGVFVPLFKLDCDAVAAASDALNECIFQEVKLPGGREAKSYIRETLRTRLAYTLDVFEPHRRTFVPATPRRKRRKVDPAEANGDQKASPKRAPRRMQAVAAPELQLSPTGSPTQFSLVRTPEWTPKQAPKWTRN